MALRLVDVTIKVGEKTLFKNFNLEVGRGKICALMGPSGSGKSSLFNFILGSLSADFAASGEIWLNDLMLNPLPIEKRQIGILFQDPCLFPHLSVRENLAFGMQSQNQDKRGKETSEKRNKKISEALHQAQLRGLEDQNPETLSGGERTRIGLLRTLLSQPQAILLDEPFSKLDKDLRYQFKDWVFNLLHERPIPVILITHDREDIPSQCERVIELTYA